MGRLFTKENLARLAPLERREFMRLQMSKPTCGGSDYLPDDCGECGACGQPTLGFGWCRYCHKRYEELRRKASVEAQG
jgi:hypothetical protein